MKKTFNFNGLFFLFAAALLIISCESVNNRDSTFQPRSTSSIRLDDIRNQITDNPVHALALINIYKEVYSPSQNVADYDWDRLFQYEEEAKRNLIALQEKAIEEEQWENVISLGRSIASLGIITANTGMEAAFILADAKKKLSEGNNLGAFLAAVKSHEIRPMDFESALLFLEKAVEARQRRTASFFLSAAENAGGRNIPGSLREFAMGSDTVSDMVKGVATVIVDRGFRIERGQGMSNRVLGSAFFVDSSGLLITNYHVIASEVDPAYRGFSRMFIRMGDAASPRIPARVIGWDNALDLALI
jgi:hypothetical protein